MEIISRLGTSGILFADQAAQSMDDFGQHVSNLQPEYSCTQDFEDMAVFSGDHFNVHRQDLHQTPGSSSLYGISEYTGPNTNPHCRFGGSAIKPSCINENSSGYLPSDYANSQAQDLTPAGYKEPEMPCAPNLDHSDLIQTARPPYSYPALIAMALQNAPEKMLPLSEICHYVMDNFPFYKTKTGWQNCISTNLSNYGAFMKVARDDCDPGKGSYWTFDPNSERVFNSSIFKWQWKECNNWSGKFSRSDGLAGPPENTMFSPALDTNPCFSNFTYSVNEMNNGASTLLTEDFSCPTPCFTEFSPYPTDNHHSSSLPEESTSQDLALPNISEEPVLFSSSSVYM
ncbi:forkhead box protein I2-A-like [Phyllobates terribilis]|uniref:forkhead box protein I2-A-like n=1 Tax=Phyllobates terribilis TaxID=111132 RepID=UPI003CCAD5FB